MNNQMTRIQRGFVLFCLVFFLGTICFETSIAAASDQETEIDYNRYIDEFTYAACLEDAAVFSCGDHLGFIRTDGDELHLVPCLRPDCDHAEGKCFVEMPRDSRFFVSEDHIYFIDLDEESQRYALKRMNRYGEEKEIVFFMDEIFPGVDYEEYVTQFKLFQEKAYFVTAPEEQEKQPEQRHNAPKQVVMVDLSQEEYEPILLFDVLHEKLGTSISLMNVYEKFVFAWKSSLDSTILQLWMYNLETGEQTLICEPWGGGTQFTLAEDRLYCNLCPLDIFSVSLEDRSKTMYRQFEEYEYGVTGYDESYLYMTNTLMLSGGNQIDRDRVGLYIYDYEGNEIQTLLTKEEGIFPAFLLAAKDYIFFYEVRERPSQVGRLPRYYIRKADIGTENLKFYELDHPKGEYADSPSYEEPDAEFCFSEKIWSPILMFEDQLYMQFYAVQNLPKAESLTLYGDFIHTFEEQPACNMEYSSPYDANGQVYYYPDDLSHVYVVLQPKEGAEKQPLAIILFKLME